MSTIDDIQNDAARRWLARTPEREAMARNLANGQPAETPARTQQRLRHLSDLATGAGLGLERILGADDLRPMNFLRRATAAARSVGRVVIRDRFGDEAGYGTGFLVSPNLLMTNNHVLAAADSASASLIEFDYDVGIDGQPMVSAKFALAPERFFMTDERLDFTLVAVAPVSDTGITLAQFGAIRLIGAVGKALVGDAVNIIQHPKGEHKKIAFRGNPIVDIFDDFLHYTTDTEPGASGAPAFNDQWELVALHHSGVPATHPDGTVVRVNGQIQWVANEGIRVSSLVRFIQSQTLTGQADELRRELLAAPARSAGDAETLALGNSAAGQAVLRFTAWGQEIAIPLVLRLQLGAPLVTPPSLVLPPAPAQVPEHEDGAAQRSYYDAAADAAAVASYYEAIAFDADPETLFQQLSELLTRTHRNVLPYSPSTQLYPWVDLHPAEAGRASVLRSVYSGKAFSAQELIALDEEVDRKRAQLRERLPRPEASGREAVQAEEAYLEASFPYNCEHVVPQSWFNKRQPMRGDLHHLFACESKCNSFRGNTPYQDFPDWEEAVRPHCGRSEPGGFEPHFGKGAVARATLYFLLRYPGEINRSERELRLERLDVLLDWHERYEVTEYERHRNAAIFDKQANRNPLIDHPGCARQLNFALGLG